MEGATLFGATAPNNVAPVASFRQDGLMRAKTEEFLYCLLWAAETLSRPTWRNLTESFEGWAYRSGLRQQLLRLEKQQWIERQAVSDRNRVLRLTEIGRLQALGGRDPEARWRRRWDGRWRLIAFDVPEARRTVRNKLRRYLRERGFGFLQNSVWITPDPVTELRAVLAKGPANVEEMILFEARAGGGESDDQIVAGAWDFRKINERYVQHRKVLVQRPRGTMKGEAAAGAFRRWLRAEREAWSEAVMHDPLLPRSLLPDGYAGRQASQERLTVMREAGAQIRSFKLE